MVIQTHTTDRKALAKAIAEELGTDFRYMGMPTCGYSVGEYTVDREGNIVGEDFGPLHDFLLRNGFIAEDAERPQIGHDEPEDDPAVDPGEAQLPAGNTDVDGDLQTITFPAPGITVEQLRNLTYTLYGHQHIINLMTGRKTIQIPVELIEALKEALPATRRDFTALLDSFRELGLKGFDFRDEKFSLTFPFYETDPNRWTAFAGLQGRIMKAAQAATRVFPELLEPAEEAEKYTAHMWLQRLGYSGSDFKAERKILLGHLHGYCAFSNGAKMQSHKERYTAIRRERREAERLSAANAEPDSTALVSEEEVAGND